MMKLICAFCAFALLGTTQVRAIDLAVPGGGNFSVPAKTLKELRSQGIVFQKHDFSCGSAAIATLLRYHYQIEINEQQVFQAMYQSGDQAKIRREGFSLLDMKNFLERLGFQADGFKKPLADLQRFAVPAVALIRDNGYNHFIVIKGIRDDRILLGDPAMGLRTMTLDQFEAIWPSKILFVIHSHQDRAVVNIPAEWSARPKPPLAAGVARDSLLNDLMRRSPGDLM